jgi:isocitrate dehydrogenase
LAGRIKVSIAKGDGIGPEIMDATLAVLEASGAPVDFEPVAMGKQLYEQGLTSGISAEAIESVRTTKVLLKAPLTTPQGRGVKSVNVTMRTTFGLYANVRPARALSPYVPTEHPGMDLVIVRENEEDVYGGVEYRMSTDTIHALKISSRLGAIRVIRYAFELARITGKLHVTCMTKDNILKMTDGQFHDTFDEIAESYPDVETDHYIIDIGMATLATQPERFGIIVTPNLYGDIASDVAAQVSGSVGLAGSANVGEEIAMFEAVHGSAPDIAGKQLANPSGLLVAAVMMLNHLGLSEHATLVHNAWLRTIEDGIHTADIYASQTSTQKVGTMAFAQSVIERLGESPRVLRLSAPGVKPPSPTAVTQQPAKKQAIGADIFVEWNQEPEALAQMLAAIPPAYQLSSISCRGQSVYPVRAPETNLSDLYRLRFKFAGSAAGLSELIAAVVATGVDFSCCQVLYDYDGVRGYSLAQGE